VFFTYFACFFTYFTCISFPPYFDYDASTHDTMHVLDAPGWVDKQMGRWVIRLMGDLMDKQDNIISFIDE